MLCKRVRVWEFTALLLLLFFAVSASAAVIDCSELAEIESCDTTGEPSCAGGCVEVPGYGHFACGWQPYTTPICGAINKCMPETCKPCKIEVEDVRIEFDPEYRETTKEKRLFDPQKHGMTAFDDIVVDFTLLVCGNTTCLERAIEKEKTGKLFINDSLQLNLPPRSVKLLGSKPAPEAGEDCTHLLYRWKDELKGWDNGSFPGFVGSEDALETLIQEKTLWATVEVDGKEKTSKKKKTSNCVLLYGADGSVENKKAKRQFVYAQDDTFEKGVAEFVGIAQEAIQGSFEETEPFKSNKDKLAHYIELKKGMLPWGRSRGSDCLSKANGAITVEFTRDIFPNHLWVEGMALRIVSGKIFLAGHLLKSLSETLMHEVGHTLCGLDDESTKTVKPKYAKGQAPLEELFLGTNCRLGEDAFGIYGNFGIPGCISTAVFIPSRFSLMNYAPKEDKRFNVVSCGFCLNAINRTHGSEAFDTCLNGNFDVIKPSEECKETAHCTTQERYERPYCTFCNSDFKCEERGEVPCFSNVGSGPYFGLCRNGECSYDESIECVRKMDCDAYQEYHHHCIESCTDGTCVPLPDGTSCMTESGRGACAQGVCYK